MKIMHWEKEIQILLVRRSIKSLILNEFSYKLKETMSLHGELDMRNSFFREHQEKY